MKAYFSSNEIMPGDLPKVGGKAHALAKMKKAGFRIPDFICITTDAYQHYLDYSGLRERILLELHRKSFEDMRWEEIWDCATRIRSLFLRNPMPSHMASGLEKVIQKRFGNQPVAVRSSAPEEDVSTSSFAGLHESYVNLRGVDAILESVKKVWASLWSDAALLYRKELGLNVAESAMAVVVQEMIEGERSGVAFSRSPNAPSQGVIESVYGLNQGLVDGDIEPDRWVLDRQRRKIISRQPADRRFQMVPTGYGTKLQPLSPETAAIPPLNDPEVLEIYRLCLKAEAFFGAPQDVEWTLWQNRLYLLQSRPVTTGGSAETEDKRTWYLSLHRSFENLKALRNKIENEHFPAMIQTAEELLKVDLQLLSDEELATEIHRRWSINNHWVNVYWSDFIPFAHGIRLFGQVYNDVIKPEDPYAFVDLLSQTGMISLERNHKMEMLAGKIQQTPRLADCLRHGDCEQKAPDFQKELEYFIERFGDLSCAVTGGTQCEDATQPLIRILLQMTARPPKTEPYLKPDKDREESIRQFLDAFSSDKRREAEELLDLARVSYQLRDDDNIHVGRIESQLIAAVQEGHRRLSSGQTVSPDREKLESILAQTNVSSKPGTSYPSVANQKGFIKPRQLLGQPAGPGVARGTARVILRHSDLADFTQGEVLVCDAVDPNMTFVVPLASAVVERRGGMLIHGAIIAREYGLPCVTGISQLTDLVNTGEILTVDGYLGIVTVGTGEL